LPGVIEVLHSLDTTNPFMLKIRVGKVNWLEYAALKSAANQLLPPGLLRLRTFDESDILSENDVATITKVGTGQYHVLINPQDLCPIVFGDAALIGFGETGNPDTLERVQAVAGGTLEVNFTVEGITADINLQLAADAFVPEATYVATVTPAP
ncbi:MAG TPA: hypothetical protein VGM23_18360, partial [Armatimonadota bacterium]